MEESLSKTDFQILREVLDVIWEILLDGSIPKTDVLNQLDMQFMQIEGDDPLAAIDGPPVASSVQNAIGLCILGCRRRDVLLTVRVGEAVVEALDYELAERDPDYAARSLDEMFEHPSMKKELEAQLAMIRYLRGEHPLDESLRSMFRVP